MHRNAEWLGRKVDAPDKLKRAAVRIHSVHLQLLNGLALFSNEIEFVGSHSAGRERDLQHGRRSCDGLPLYPEQSFVTWTPSSLHKFGADEENITLRLCLGPLPTCARNLCASLCCCW